MRKSVWRLRNFVTALVLLVVYVAALYLSLSESSRRSLQLRDDASSADHIIASVLVTSVNPASQELTAQISFRPLGALAQDEVTPAVDLKVIVNNVASPQQFDFPKGKRMNRINVVFPMNGNLNRYPFDRYSSTIRLVVSTPAKKKQAQAVEVPESAVDQALQSEIGANALQESTLMPITLNLSAATPGIKFEGSVSPESGLKYTVAELKIRRANNVIAVSMLVMTLMAGLASSLIAMVIRATRGNKVDLVPLSMSISLIFGLPALRNVQPGVPPVGALGDYVAFIWAEMAVGISAIIIVWTWVLRSRDDSA